ncbi:MAG: molybdenum cofactor biosynthesis protein MoaE [Acidobacteriota bacterium]|jgi:molybdopterin synthase catalytic subunit
MIRLTDAPIDPAPLMETVRSPKAGAIATFDGRVRDTSDGRSVTHLVYEAYESMALLELDKLVRSARDQWALEGVSIVHRIGRLEIEETSVFIAVSAAHRADAFAACRYLIDSIKQTVPIWKKEYFRDGSVWVEGP